MHISFPCPSHLRPPVRPFTWENKVITTSSATKQPGVGSAGLGFPKCHLWWLLRHPLSGGGGAAWGQMGETGKGLGKGECGVPFSPRHVSHLHF